jgi:hypothetical protein
MLFPGVIGHFETGRDRPQFGRRFPLIGGVSMMLRIMTCAKV